MQQASAAHETPLPRAVADRVNKMKARIAARGEQPNPKPAESNTPPEPETPSLEAPTTATPAEATPPEPAPALAEPVDPRHNDPRYWEMRYRTEAGMHKSTKRAQQAQIEGMQQQIADLQEKLRAAQASAPPAPIDITEYFTPEEIEKYGPEQCETMARVAKRTAEKQASAAVREAVEPLKQTAQQTQARSAADEMEQFKRELTKLVADWETVDKTQKWQDWLEEPDPETGIQYGLVLDHHVKARNAPAVAKLFQKYRTVTQVQVPVPPVAPMSSAAAPTLETPPNPEGNGLPPGLTPLRKGEAQEFYKRAALGKVSDEERKVFEARLRLGRPG